MQTEAENPEIKKINGEIISMTHNTKKEYTAVHENPFEVDTFTQDMDMDMDMDIDMHISDCEGQFM
jgi:hypothetical protein